MFGRILALSVVLAAASIGWAAGEDEQKAGNDLRAIQSMADDLRLRDHALGELSHFLSTLRTQVRGHCYLMKKFMASQGKLDDYINTDVKVVESEAAYMEAVGKKKELDRAGIVLPDAPMTFEQAVELTVQYVESEGLPHMDVADADELEMLKRSCKAKANLARKVFDHLTDMFHEEMAMLAYLKSIGKEQAFRKYASLEIERERRARQAQEAAAGSIRRRMHRMGLKQRRKLSTAKRYERILREFKLKQQLTEQQTKVKMAEHQQGGRGMPGRTADPDRRYCDYGK